MTEAPERIWATEDAKNYGEDRFHSTMKFKGGTEYVRSDIYTDLETKLAASEARVKELTEACEQLRMDAWGHGHLFESGFHARVFETLDHLIQPTPEGEQP